MPPEDEITVEVDYVGSSEPAELVYTFEFIREWVALYPDTDVGTIGGLATLLGIGLGETVRTGAPVLSPDRNGQLWMIPASSVRAIRVVARRSSGEPVEPLRLRTPIFWTPDAGAQRPA